LSFDIAAKDPDICRQGPLTRSIRVPTGSATEGQLLPAAQRAAKADGVRQLEAAARVVQAVQLAFRPGGWGLAELARRPDLCLGSRAARAQGVCRDWCLASI